ncbi:MAG: TIGR04076 family protein [Candidatus Bathyarchaeia archaeon]
MMSFYSSLHLFFPSVLDKLVIRVKEIKGRCAVFKGGEKIVVEGAEVNLREMDKICIHALASLLHYLVALREGVNPVGLGLSREEEKAYIQCLDPGEPYTNGGTVVSPWSLRSRGSSL